MKLCSACLLGIKCRYDNKAKPHKGVIRLAQKEALIPVCPEQLGGLPTPRHMSVIKGDKVVMEGGKDVTRNFKRGARIVLKIARIYGVEEVIFKEKSPACGSKGVATKLLRKNGIKVTNRLK
jgi:uncharacterized protein YbbK (DUF523 family)